MFCATVSVLVAIHVDDFHFYNSQPTPNLISQCSNLASLQSLLIFGSVPDGMGLRCRAGACRRIARCAAPPFVLAIVDADAAKCDNLLIFSTSFSGARLRTTCSSCSAPRIRRAAWPCAAALLHSATLHSALRVVCA